MSERPALPLSALLSQTLVALTIDLDNEFERRMPHRTTTSGASAGGKGGPWLTSVAMWASCLRFVDDDGITPDDLARAARLKTNLHGMQRWRYVVLGDDGKLRPTRMGRQARETWPTVFGVVKSRWRERFGAAAIDELRAALEAIARRLEPGLPDFLPIIGYDLSTTRALDGLIVAPSELIPAGDLPLPALLSKTLIDVALGFEARSKLSLAIAANVVRLLDDEGVRVRDLPRRSGVSKEAIAMALGYLERNTYVRIAPDPANARVKLAVPTDCGKRARDGYGETLVDVERRIAERFLREPIERLRGALEHIVRPGSGSERSPLFDCIVPQPDNWRAAVAPPDELPHFPMILHRGGYPDGS